MHQNPILQFGLAALAMFLYMVNLSFVPEHISTTHFASLRVSPIDDLSLKRTKCALRILRNEIS